MMLPSYTSMSPLLSIPLADPPLRQSFDEPTADALAEYQNDYARRSGYARGTHGEWITERRRRSRYF